MWGFVDASNNSNTCLVEPACNGKWTKFFDRDNPSGFADAEDLSGLRRSYPGQICPVPSAIDARLITGEDYRTAGQVVRINSTFGFTCHHQHQKKKERCRDYMVRFCCPTGDTNVYCKINLEDANVATWLTSL